MYGNKVTIVIDYYLQKYSTICQVPNTNLLPGPGIPFMGSSTPNNGYGHVIVGVGFGYGNGAIPGFGVVAGTGVDVGPSLGMENTPNIGVGVGATVGVLGATGPQQPGPQSYGWRYGNVDVVAPSRR